MPIPPQLQRLLHNKWALTGLAGAAGVGGFVLYKRSKSGGGSNAQGTSDTTTGQATNGGTATLDTSGTDIANWLGQYSASLQNELDQYQQQLTDALQNLQQMPTTGGTPPTGTTPPPSVTTQPIPGPVSPKTTPPPKPTKGPVYQAVAKYTTHNAPWNSTLSGIAAHYHTSVGALMKLNPSVRNANLIHPGQKIRVS